MYIRGFLHLFRHSNFVLRISKAPAHKKPFRRGREGLFVFRDPSWSRGQNCWDELGIPFCFEVAPEVHQTNCTGQEHLSATHPVDGTKPKLLLLGGLLRRLLDSLLSSFLHCHFKQSPPFTYLQI
jgi:hypothetical protein